MAISIYHFWGLISRCKLLLGLLYLRYFSVTFRFWSEKKAKKKRRRSEKRTENERKTIEKRSRNNTEKLAENIKNFAENIDGVFQNHADSQDAIQKSHAVFADTTASLAGHAESWLLCSDKNDIAQPVR